MLRGFLNVRLAGCVFFLAAACSGRGFAYEPTGSIDELSRLELLARLRPGVVCRMFSSYDRTGGNNDGFAGTYSKLRVEDGRSVLAEMTGAGCIQRIWFTHSEFKVPGLLERKGEHIRIYVDGQSTPALDIPLEDLFSGQLARFPKPLVGEASGGFYCYVPIPYRGGCKVEVDGTAVRFYQINYNSFPSGRGVESFRMELDPSQRRQLDDAVRVWSHLGDLSALSLARAVRTEKNLAAEGASPHIELPAGPRIVRGLLLNGTPEQLSQCAGVRLHITWDGATGAAVDVPLSNFFGQALEPQPYQSLLLGANQQGWYNFLPMPYRQSARIEVAGSRPLPAQLAVITEPLDSWPEDAAYLHATYHEQLPTENGQYYSWLYRTNQRGHYAGTYLQTVGVPGQNDLPYWLEGDDRFTVDEELAIHGTGSEDYFNCGWYAVEGRLNRPAALPLHGFPIYYQGAPSCRAVAYRWHLTDPVPYRRSLRAEIEHGAGRNFPTEYRSVVFHYSNLPFVPDETAPRTELSAGGFRIAAFTGGLAETQQLGPPGETAWSNGDQLFWTGAKVKDRLELALDVPQAGRYALDAIFTQARDYAIVQIYLDGQKLADPIDLFQPNVARSEPIPLGVRELSAGEHRLAIEIVGANAEAVPSHFVGLDDIRLTPAENK